MCIPIRWTMYQNMAVTKEKDLKGGRGVVSFVEEWFIPLVGSQVPVNKRKKLSFFFLLVQIKNISSKLNKIQG